MPSLYSDFCLNCFKLFQVFFFFRNWFIQTKIHIGLHLSLATHSPAWAPHRSDSRKPRRNQRGLFMSPTQVSVWGQRAGSRKMEGVDQRRNSGGHHATGTQSGSCMQGGAWGGHMGGCQTHKMTHQVNLPHSSS